MESVNYSSLQEAFSKNEYIANATTEHALGTSEDSFNRLLLAKLLLLQPHSIIGLILGALSIVLNGISILALSHVRNRKAAHFQLIKSLAYSDILIGVAVIAHSINRALNPVRGLSVGTDEERRMSFCMFMTLKAVFGSSLNITLFNLLLMAIDHYYAILKPLSNTRRTITAKK